MPGSSTPNPRTERAGQACLERLDEEGLVEFFRKGRIRNCGIGRFESRPVERPRWIRTMWNETVYCPFGSHPGWRETRDGRDAHTGE
jgi:hypothetical protein